MSRVFKVFYVLLIIVCVLYPLKMIVAPITIRHIFSLFMFVFCLFLGFKIDKYIILYLAFLFFLGISSVITGFLGTYVNKLFGTYLPAIAVWMSTYLLVKKYKGIGVLVWLFVGIGVLNAIITIGQFFGLDFVNTLFERFQFATDEVFLEKTGRRLTAEGLVIPGLFNSVLNGYFLSASALLILYNKKCNLIINIVLWLIVVVASFMAQERAGFFLAIAFSAYIIVQYFFSKSRGTGIVMTSILVITLIIVASTCLDFLFSSDFRFAKGFESDGRSELRNVAWRYLFNNPLGGVYEFFDANNRPPHNYFTNAFLYGGIFGGVSLIVLLILQVVRILPFVVHIPKTDNDKWAFIWGLMYIDLSINSMVHNASLVTGQLLFFYICWSAFQALSTLEEKMKTENLETTVPLST